MKKALLLLFFIATGWTTKAQTVDHFNKDAGMIYKSSANIYTVEPGESNVEISIFNLLGKKLYFQNSINEIKVELNLSELENGIYFLEVKKGAKVKIERFVKN